MTWRTVSVSVIGTAHETHNSRCQDATASEIFGTADEIAVLALSDGAGSAPHSAEASRLIVDSWIGEFRRHFADNPNPEELVSDYQECDCIAALEACRQSLQQLADTSENDLTEYAATMLGAVMSPSGGFVVQVGDGAWVSSISGIIGSLTIPTEGEYVGQTTFLTSTAWLDEFQFVRLPSRPNWLVGFTDGMQRLALDSQGLQPSPTFFEPLVKGIIRAGDHAHEALSQFLQSDRVCSRTDDDKSFAFLIDGDFR